LLRIPSFCQDLHSVAQVRRRSDITFSVSECGKCRAVGRRARGGGDLSGGDGRGGGRLREVDEEVQCHRGVPRADVGTVDWDECEERVRESGDCNRRSIDSERGLEGCKSGGVERQRGG
jgi:hypothetical protein